MEIGYWPILTVLLEIGKSSGLSLTGDSCNYYEVLKLPYVLPANMLGWTDGWGVGGGRAIISEVVTYLPTWMSKVKPWIKPLHRICETGFVLFLNMSFAFHHVTLWACSKPFLSFRCAPMGLRIGMQCDKIISQLMESLSKSCMFTAVLLKAMKTGSCGEPWSPM